MEENKKLVENSRYLMDEKMTPINNFHQLIGVREN